jgi:hypothetical protein
MVSLSLLSWKWGSPARWVSKIQIWILRTDPINARSNSSSSIGKASTNDKNGIFFLTRKKIFWKRIDLWDKWSSGLLTEAET